MFKEQRIAYVIPRQMVKVDTHFTNGIRLTEDMMGVNAYTVIGSIYESRLIL